MQRFNLFISWTETSGFSFQDRAVPLGFVLVVLISHPRARRQVPEPLPDSPRPFKALRWRNGANVDGAMRRPRSVGLAATRQRGPQAHGPRRRRHATPGSLARARVQMRSRMGRPTHATDSLTSGSRPGEMRDAWTERLRDAWTDRLLGPTVRTRTIDAEHVDSATSMHPVSSMHTGAGGV
ncbi:hypothetical protein M885DRAFT_214626 [Pelagophyceae sp. CCMP2097]|nr:hypothetical protein M885DRAFT_214626 [Pelagophyceae sp. CCMP2097]